MEYNPEETSLAFLFKWTRLHNRLLSSWAQPGRYLPPHGPAYQDEVITFVNVPLATPLSALPQYVSQVVQPLFEIFGGFTLSTQVIEDLTRRLTERRF